MAACCRRPRPRERAVGMIECGPAAGVIGSQLPRRADGRRATSSPPTWAAPPSRSASSRTASSNMRASRWSTASTTSRRRSTSSRSAPAAAASCRSTRAPKLPRVGPHSAGARPGPVCYGLGGTEPTLTDVLLLIGYMDPGHFLARHRCRSTSSGARRVFKEQDRRAARHVGRGGGDRHLPRRRRPDHRPDPQDHGRARARSARLRAARLRRHLRHARRRPSARSSVRRIVIPYTASVNCAFGLVSADVAHEYSTTDDAAGADAAPSGQRDLRAA